MKERIIEYRTLGKFEKAYELVQSKLSDDIDEKSYFEFKLLETKIIEEMGDINDAIDLVRDIRNKLLKTEYKSLLLDAYDTEMYFS